MNIIKTISAMRQWRQTTSSVALVPTMGNLHAGHIALIKAAREHADKVTVSIFVNRLQFGPSEDFDAYPRTLEADCAKLHAAGVDTLFVPNETTLYPHTTQAFYVEPPPIQNDLCGAFRPGHFRGVATVITKLFNIVQPDVACFGKKDYQQLWMIQHMVNDLHFPIRIIHVDTERAEDALALSSRNHYLTEAERREAPLLFHNLTYLKTQLLAGNNDFADLCQSARQNLGLAGWSVDYIEIRNAETLQLATADSKHLVILGAAHLGQTRLIDNIEVVRNHNC